MNSNLQLKQINKIIVVGAGTIGRSLTFALAKEGYQVVVVTRRGDIGYKSLCCFIEKATKTRSAAVVDKKELLSRISWVNDFSEDTADADLVIEAVKEDLAEKQQLFGRIDRIYPPHVILSSVTSSLSITEISKSLDRPDRMLGLHFFNPANHMKLVEIVPGDKTSKETIEKAQLFVKTLGKTPLITPDIPGFIVNRILFAMINEAIGLLEEGAVSAEDIDASMKLGVNHPMGPLSLADFIGLDNCLNILENLYKRTKRTEFIPNRLLSEKVKNKEFGRKTGKGFFYYKTEF